MGKTHRRRSYKRIKMRVPTKDYIRNLAIRKDVKMTPVVMDRSDAYYHYSLAMDYELLMVTLGSKRKAKDIILKICNFQPKNT